MEIERLAALSLPVSVASRDRVRVGFEALSILVLAAAAFVAVQVTGGSPNALNNLGYASIVLAAYLFGWRGALPAGILIALLLGPTASLLGLPNGEPPGAWAARGASYIAMGGVLGVLFDRMRLAVDRWQQAAERVSRREREGMVALARGAEAKDTDTGEHVLRVQLLASALAGATGMDRTIAADIGWAAMLHDVGKLHVPDRILLKPGPLAAEEWEVMRLHPVWGERILEGGDGFALARRIARWHHENFDGSGYPDGLARDRIPLEARIVRVADAFDAMTNRRPYSEPRPFDVALEELERCAGVQFDPDIVELMVRLLSSDLAFRHRLAALRRT